MCFFLHYLVGYVYIYQHLVHGTYQFQPLNNYLAAVWKKFIAYFTFYLFVKIANIFHGAVYIQNHKKVLDGFRFYILTVLYQISNKSGFEISCDSRFMSEMILFQFSVLQKL